MSRSSALTDVPLSRSRAGYRCDDANHKARVGFPALPNGSRGLGGQSRRTIGMTCSASSIFLRFLAEILKNPALLPSTCFTSHARSPRRFPLVFQAKRDLDYVCPRRQVHPWKNSRTSPDGPAIPHPSDIPSRLPA